MLQAAVAVFLVLALAFHWAEVGLIGLAVIRAPDPAGLRSYGDPGPALYHQHVPGRISGHYVSAVIAVPELRVQAGESK